MPLPIGDIVRYSWGGGIASSERWSVNVWQVVEGWINGPSDAQMAALATQGLAHFESTWDFLKAKNTSGTNFDSCRVAWYRGGILQKTAQATQTPVVGTGSAPQPVFTSRVVTLLTNRSGRSFRGRSYLPWNAEAPNAATGLWTADTTNLTNFKNTLTACTADLLAIDSATGASPAVISEVQAVATPVFNLRMDNKPDTQRGREKKIQPTSVVTIPVP